MAFADDVRQLFQQQMGRQADAGGLDYYTKAMQNGASVQDIVGAMQASPEMLARNNPAPTSVSLPGNAGAGGFLPDGRHYLDVVGSQLEPSMNAAFQYQQSIMGNQPTTAPTAGQSQSGGAQSSGLGQMMQGLQGMGWDRSAPQLTRGPDGRMYDRAGNPYGDVSALEATMGNYGNYGGGGEGYGQQSPTQNPYLPQITEAMQAQNQFALQNGLNSIRSNAVGVGGLGGSRQGVAEGVATGLAAQGLTGQLANLYGSSWNADQDRALTTRAQDMGFYGQQRGQDLQSMQVGANLWQIGQQAPWTPIQNANGIYGNYTGLGNTTTNTSSGGGWQGAVGGALAGASAGRQMGWW